MAKMELAAKATDDRQHVYLELRMDGKPLGHIFLSPAEAEEHALTIASKRALLIDEVGREIEPNARFGAVYDPIWRTLFDHSAQEHGIALLLRHPGLGWLSFLLPHKEAANLGQWLVDHSSPPLTDTPTPSESS